VADEPTTGELMRRLEDVRLDLKEDLQSLATRLDGKVDTKTLDLRQQAQDERAVALADRVKAIETAAKEKEKERAADRRLILAALVVPVLLVFLQVYLSTKGAGG
jgi:hypothetical protein